MTEKPADQVKLEAAVAKVAKAYDELVKVVEKGSTIEESHVAKVFNFAAKVHADSHSKALLSITTAKASNGGFSLDAEYDPMPSPILTPSLARPVKERVVGDGKGKPKPPSDDDGCDFIDD